MVIYGIFLHPRYRLAPIFRVVAGSEDRSLHSLCSVSHLSSTFGVRWALNLHRLLLSLRHILSGNDSVKLQPLLAIIAKLLKEQEKLFMDQRLITNSLPFALDGAHKQLTFFAEAILIICASLATETGAPKELIPNNARNRLDEHRIAAICPPKLTNGPDYRRELLFKARSAQAYLHFRFVSCAAVVVGLSLI